MFVLPVRTQKEQTMGDNKNDNDNDGFFADFFGDILRFLMLILYAIVFAIVFSVFFLPMLLYSKHLKEKEKTTVHDLLNEIHNQHRG